MKKVFNLFCCCLTFLMILSLMLFVSLSLLEACLNDIYMNSAFFIKPSILTISVLVTGFIIKKYYNFSTHHLFRKN